MGSYQISGLKNGGRRFTRNLSSGRLRELKTRKGKAQSGNPKSGRARLRERSLT